MKVLRGTFDRKDDPGEISHFRALSAALSATIGAGNIVGVAAVVCTITALVIICTGAETVAVKGKLTSAAFEMGLPGSGKLASLAIIFFAFSTLLSWSYYGDRAVDYLFGKKAVLPYRLVYVGFVILGSVIHLNVVIDFCDAMNGLMAIPNLIALIMTPLLVSLMHDYMKRMKAEKYL